MSHPLGGMRLVVYIIGAAMLTIGAAVGWWMW